MGKHLHIVNNEVDLEGASLSPSTGDLPLSTNGDINLTAASGINIDATGAVTVSGSSVTIDTTGTLDINANTSLNLDSYLTLVDTTASDEGVVYKGSDRFIHNYHDNQVLSGTLAGNNTFVGINAGNFTMGSAATETFHSSSNTAIGTSTFNSNTLGYNNTVAGANALYTNTSGHNNTVVGMNALYANTTGYYNVANGVQALRFNTEGYYNTANGTNALYANTTGYYNVADGLNAGRYITGGSLPNETSNHSVYLGASTKASASGNVNEIVLGYEATGHGSNTTTIGNTSITKAYIRGHTVTEGRISNITTISGATHSLAADDEILHVTYSGVTVTLTTAQTENGRKIYIKDAVGTASAGNITVDTEGSEKIDGQDTLTIDTDYGKETLYSDGSNWFTL